MAVNAQEAVRNMISYTVVTDKGSLVRLLERNGVQMPSNPSDKEVTASVLLASSKSPIELLVAIVSCGFKKLVLLPSLITILGVPSGLSLMLATEFTGIL